MKKSIAVFLACARDPAGFGTALRQAARNLCAAKMHNKAFLPPGRTYDDSFIGSLQKPSEWSFSFPYAVSFLRYVLNNVANAVIFAFRYIL